MDSIHKPIYPHDRSFVTSTRIHLLVSDRRFILLVFYCEEQQVWQFRVLSGVSVFGERKIYYTAEAAEKAAREWIKAGD